MLSEADLDAFVLFSLLSEIDPLVYTLVDILLDITSLRERLLESLTCLELELLVDATADLDRLSTLESESVVESLAELEAL